MYGRALTLIKVDGGRKWQVHSWEPRRGEILFDEIMMDPNKNHHSARIAARHQKIDYGHLGRPVLIYEGEKQNRATSEVRPETRMVVAREVASRILRLSDRFSAIFDEMFNSQIAFAREALLTESESGEYAEATASLLKRGGHAVQPAGFFRLLAPDAREAFFKILSQAVQKNGEPVTRPAVYFAGDEAGALIKELADSKTLKNNPGMKKIFRVVPESEWKMAFRPDVEPAAISSLRLPQEGETVTRRFAAFLLKPEEISKLSEADKLRYLLRLTELELLAAEELKFPLLSASEKDVPKLIGQFLMNVGIQDFDSTGGIFTLSTTGLLGDAFAEYLRSSLVARSA